MGDDRAVEEIVYKLKSQGLFDQLRKECLNDVDTKPAYQNLRQRVEGYVSRFLSQQTWSPDLNKNQLRDSLRRQINQSGMLSSGVERIIEQVVNPKIFTIIKPKIDEIVCKHLGIDPKDRKQQLQDRKARQQQHLQQQQLQQQQQHASEPQPLMSLHTTPGQVPGYESLQGGGSHLYAAYSPSANWHRPYGTMLNPHMNSNYQINQPFSQGFGPYGMTTPLYPYVQQGWSIPQFPGMPPPSLFTQPPPPIPTGTVSDQPTIPQTPQYTEPPPPLPTEPYTGDSDMESVPAPPPEPEPPGTELAPPGISPVTLPGSTHKPEKPDPPDTEKPVILETDKPDTQSTADTSKATDTKKEKPKVESKPADGTYNILKDIPLPIPLPREHETNRNPNKEVKRKSNGSKSKEKAPNHQDKGRNGAAKSTDKIEKNKDSENTSKVSNGNKSSDKKSKSDKKDSVLSKSGVDAETKAVEGLTTENLEKLEESQQAKQYTFSWTKGADVDEVSSMTVSSVHTSDISSFEDDLGSDSDPEEPAMEEEKDNVLPEIVTTEDTAGDSADVSGSQSESVEIMSPVKPKEMTVSSEVISPPKPKTLISLKYNYSDSDEDETREERKARIANEKEERYVKRQQRRAELDAKRKEREEERTRMKEEKKTKLSDSDKTTLSEESETGKPSSPLSDPLKSEESEEKSTTTIPASPKKKTKQELKEQLREQKVMEKKQALRRQRTRNRRYTSEEFTSIFTEKRQPYSSQSYTSVEEVVETEECVVETTIVVDEQTIPMEVIETEEVVESVTISASKTHEIVAETETVSVSNTPEGTPPGSPKSPATPTQDEPAVYSDGSTALPTGIPVYEISAIPATSLTIGQVVHETRSRTRKISDERKSNETHSTGRPGSPFSDISDNSKPESFGDTPERRSKRRRLGSTSPLGVDSGGKTGRRISAVSPSDLKSGEGSESRSRGKRYSVDDLYKPKTRHRRSFSPPPSPPIKPKTSTPGGRLRSSPMTDRSMSPPPPGRRLSPPPLAPPNTSKSGRLRSSPMTDRSMSPPPPGRRLSQPSPPPLAPPNTSKRYDAEDLYKPRVPSSRSSRYLQRQPSEPSPSTSKTTKPSEKGSKRELPFAAKEFTEEGPVEEERAVSPSEAERKRIKRPIAFVNFGEAARMSDHRKPQEPKFRGRTWGRDRGRFDRKTQRKYYDGGWSDIEKTGSRSPASSHSSGSGSQFVRREPMWKDTYDSEPSIVHRSGSHSPSKLSRTFDSGELSSSSVGKNRSPFNYEQSQSVSGMRPPSPQSTPVFETRRPPSPQQSPPVFDTRRPPSPQSPPAFDTRRPPSPYSPSSRHQLSPVSPEGLRPPSPPSPGLHRPPSPPVPGSRRPLSPPSSVRRPPSPPSPESHRPLSPPSPDDDLGPRTRRHRPVTPESPSGRQRGSVPSATASPVRRQTRNSLYHPIMLGPLVGRGGGWEGRQNTADEGRYLRSRSPGRGHPGMNRDRRSSNRVGKGRVDPSPPSKRPKR